VYKGKDSLYKSTKAHESHPNSVENHQVLIMQKTKSHQAHVLHPASSYLHMRGQTSPSLGSRRVSKHELGNPRLENTGKRCTQLIMWVSMMKMPIQMRSFQGTLRTMPQNSNSRRRTSATISKKATVSRRSKRRTNTSITRYMSWTNTRSTRSMPTITTKPTRKGVKESIDKARSCARFTSLHAMRKAMNTR